MTTLTNEQFAEYKRKLDEDGYVVIKGAVEATKAQEYASRFWDYLESLSKENKIDRTNPDTWRGEHWIQNIHGIIKHYNVGHQQFVWDARDEDGIVSFFEKYWKTKDLLVSFDGACIIRGVKGGDHSKWAHTDQAPVLKIKENNGKAKEVRDFDCVQGLLNLRPCGPDDGGLVVYKGSHLGHQQFFTDKGNLTADEMKRAGKKGDEASWKDSTNNWYKLDLENEVDAAHLEKYERVKVCCDPGDFIVWYSRTIHYAEAIDSKRNTDPMAHRMCIYICMLPKKYATENDLKKKKEALNDLRTTSHWPCIKITLNPLNPRTYGKDSVLENFVTPTTKPVLTDRMKRMAGVPHNFVFKEKAKKEKSVERPTKKAKLEE
jgi:ectoine hydroxylase-related dioxygenase (phytanoyl-CoA dioxygenase family)